MKKNWIVCDGDNEPCWGDEEKVGVYDNRTDAEDRAKELAAQHSNETYWVYELVARVKAPVAAPVVHDVSEE